MGTLKTCPNCNNEYSIANKFCSNCGTENINSIEKESTKKVKKSQLKLISGIIVFLTIIISIGLLYAENNKFSIIAGTWIEEKEDAESESAPEIIIPEDGTMTMVFDVYETLVLSLNYELERLETNTYGTTNLTSIKVSIDDIGEQIIPDEMLDEVFNVIFEGVSPTEETEGYTTTYTMKLDKLESKNDYSSSIADKGYIIDYLGNDLMEFTMINSDSTDDDNSSSVIKFHRDSLDLY